MCWNIHRDNGETTEQFTLEFPMLGTGRKESGKNTGRLSATGPALFGLPGPPQGSVCVRMCTGKWSGRGQSVDSVEGCLELEEGRTETEAEGAEASSLG